MTVRKSPATRYTESMKQQTRDREMPEGWWRDVDSDALKTVADVEDLQRMIKATEEKKGQQTA
jgi:hypothetical protein